MLARERLDTLGEVLPQHTFQRLVDSNLIAKATINYNPQNTALTEIVGRYYKTDAAGNRIKKDDGDETTDFRAKVRLSTELEERLLNNANIDVSEPNTFLMSIVWSVLPIVVIALLIWFFFIRQIRRVARNSPSTADLQAKSSQQQERYDKILSRWEQQADRMEAMLKKMESGSGGSGAPSE